MLQLLEVELWAADGEGAGQHSYAAKACHLVSAGLAVESRAVPLPAAEQGAGPDSLGMMPAALGSQGLLPSGMGLAG